jgi:C-terminal processing protease CtpA/Prc
MNELLKTSKRSPHRAKDSVVLYELVQGKKGEKITLSSKGRDGKVYQTSQVSSYERFAIYSRARDQYAGRDDSITRDLGEGLYYINVSALQSEHRAEVDEVLSKAKGIVLNLRSYPATWDGWSDTLARLIDKNITSLPLYGHNPYRPDRMDTEITRIEQFIEPIRPKVSVPAVVLSSKFSISQNEHALGYVQSAGIPILGEATYGIDGNITYVSFSAHPKESDGFAIIFTGMEIRQHDQSQLIGVGIIPDIEVPRTIQGIRSGEDEQLTAAIAYLKDQIERK